ncbi:1-acyl-sn-glycerol-3-phosphate acyltransferase [Mycolicibacterium cyprinidarum]|uniref:1-acyl-sn-glycerol-3-phosphate acyltransferase n=1 Tax=Mycolicibacterium cyprinidarum TaxID=2860311 RepID=A0ABQ4V601_9MYCO|nr:1-acyl-sn-glycerol-3-phosphate acyltransferase [Mycolicibacterium sp. NGTWSNA01]GJF12712.1 1-acyl-sn-glycerol-3-phosphate acyltransferase [Mycolicibacterium sp. NGTWS1803]GJF14790.1 1-acyl-sn-glycerol-3-phosphate acyltransferase [Mycolicibacterium sp. NGTWS0302]
MTEMTYGTMVAMTRAFLLATGARITYIGDENIPDRGGAVVAINHTSYVDWLAAGLVARRRRRWLRFMVKAELQRVKVINFAIKHTKTIPVDRSAGAYAYAMAVQRLREGELVGVYPEATISRSFELSEFKLGAARMAAQADVPIIPVIVWGTQRIWTKGHPKNLGPKKVPVVVSVGAPIHAADDVAQTDAALRESMTTLLHQVQQRYHHPTGAYWVPRRLGGGAPTLAETVGIDAAEAGRKAARLRDGS